MRILLIVSSLSGGGAEHVARKNLEVLLSNDNIETGLIVCDRNGTEQYEIPIFCKETNDLFGRFSLVLGTYGLYHFYLNCLKKFLPDIIHIHNYVQFSPSMIKAVRDYRLSNKCRVIMTHHTYSFICTNDAMYNYPRAMVCKICVGKFDRTIIEQNCSGEYWKSIVKFLQKRLFQRYFADNWIDQHISPSAFLKDELCHVYPNLKVEVVYNPCLESISYAQAEENRNNEIVFFGRISKEKNILGFTKCFLDSPRDCSLLIIGTGPEARKLEQLVVNKEKVRFINKFLPTEELFKQIAEAKYFILPSVWYENSPVTIVEAVNLGLIPIVSDIGGMQELITLLNVGYGFDPKLPNELLQLMPKIMDDYLADIEKLQKAKILLNRFTVDYYKNEILRLYNSC